MNVGKPDLLGPALVGGIVGAVLTMTPPFCCLNCCCGLNYVLAGALAGALYARNASKLVWLPQAGEGASTGALAGTIAGLLHGLVGGLVLFFWSVLAGRFEGGEDFLREVSQVRSWQWESHGLGPLSALALAAAHLVIHLVLGAAAGAVGGAVGVVLFRRTPAAPTPPPTTSPAPPPDEPWPPAPAQQP